jgi:hypothetical protein
MSMPKIAGTGSESGSISQRHGSADPDPDPQQNVMDPQHWWIYSVVLLLRTINECVGKEAPSPVSPFHMFLLDAKSRPIETN